VDPRRQQPPQPQGFTLLDGKGRPLVHGRIADQIEAGRKIAQPVFILILAAAPEALPFFNID